MPDYPHHSLRIMPVACSDPLGAPNATVRVGAPRQTAPEHPEQTRTNLNKIRTNPNTAERSDQIGTPLESPQNTLKKEFRTTLNARTSALAVVTTGVWDT